MKNFIERWLGLLILFLGISGYAQPAIPNEWFYFPPGFDTVCGSAPMAYTTNLLSTPVGLLDGADDNLLILDTTNLSPAYLEYYVTDTNGIDNFSYDTGTVLFYFAPNWASVSQGGTGPGETAYFLGGGDWSSNSPNGLFAIYADAYGSNIYFGGVSNGVSTNYASAPISWASNTFHQIGVEWRSYGSRMLPGSKIYLDGALAASGSMVSIVPQLGTDTNGFYTNGFFIGSDNNGFEQARGAFWNMMTWSMQYGGWYANSEFWLSLSNALATWQGSLGGGGFDGMMGMGTSGGFGMMMASIGAGNLTAIGASTNNIIGTNVYITNMSSMPDTNGDGGMTTVFTIEGGTNGALYDVFNTTNLTGNDITNAAWTWLGQGTNSGIYEVTNQPMAHLVYAFGPPQTAQSFFVLGTPQLDSDGSGFTTAYESLVIQGNPFSTNNAALPGMPLGWAFSLGLIPGYNYIANSSQRLNCTYDPVGRLDLVSGIRSETTTNDPEGNILQAH